MDEKFSQIASLIGDPVRSKIMWSLLDGRAYTATELAVYTDTSAQNISMHLNKLVTAGMLNVEKQGRHRYYNYARPEISYAIEALATLIPSPSSIGDEVKTDQPVRFCRSCYDHLAGRIGVALTENLLDKNYIFKMEKDFDVTPLGKSFFESLGIDIIRLKLEKRSFARACLDWSERKHHIAGSLGAAILSYMKVNDWIRTTDNSRAIVITGNGRQALHDRLGFNVNGPR